MIALITDKVIYEDKDTVSSEVKKISLNLINKRKMWA